MSRTANVEKSEDGKVKTHRGVFDMSPAFDKALELWCVEQDKTRTSVLRAAVAQYIDYSGELVTLVDRAASAKVAGEKRSATMQATKKAASILDQLKAKLIAGGDLDMSDIKALILQG